MTDKIVRVGGASGFWGDTAAGARQLAAHDGVNYLVFDYLAEVTMSILVKAQRRSPAAGYAIDFVSVTMREILPQIMRSGIRVVANAGGVNPSACARALQELAAEMNLAPKIAVVEGDDLLATLGNINEALMPAGIREMATGEQLPPHVLSANAYLGAFPIAEALSLGADIVITGRCVDSALTLGPLIHEFGWNADDLDQLAGGSLAGHLIECGPQATGGIFTDWENVPGWDNIGFPIAECSSDGSFVLSKPEGTGGLVTRPVAAEQMLYEIGDPAAYVLPDVICDLTQVTITDLGEDRVRIRGARGFGPPTNYKVSATYNDGYRCTGTMTVIGQDAVRKAQRNAETILARTRRMWSDAGYVVERAVEVEFVGGGSLAYPGSQSEGMEITLRLSVWHDSRDALAIFAREVTPMGTGGAPGTTGFAGGRPKVQEVVRLYSFLLPKSDVPDIVVRLGEEARPAPRLAPQITPLPERRLAGPEPASRASQETEVPLIAIAWARSGDKGNIANIGLIARSPELYAVIAREVTCERVAALFSDFIEGEVERFSLPGIGAFNFVLHGALGGGGMASLRIDPQGKSFGQILLQMTVSVPSDLL